jgi:hypothetical protein
VNRLRQLFQHRSERPALIPDPVTSEVWCDSDRIYCCRNRYEREGWEFVDLKTFPGQGVRLTFRRFDGWMGNTPRRGY